MISFEKELSELAERGTFTPAASVELQSAERRQLVSIADELRLILYVGILLLITGLGLYLKENLYRIGAGAIVVSIALAAAACYFFGARNSFAPVTKQENRLDEYLIFLGGLLLSLDVGYAESQYHILDERWTLHLLILFFIHSIAAYAFDSRMTLSLAITTLAGWLGLRSETLFGNALSSGGLEEIVLGRRAMMLAIFLILWRELDRRARESSRFTPLFEHFAALTGLLGTLMWVFDDGLNGVGMALLAVVAAVVVWHGFNSKRESFVVYAVAALVIGILSTIGGLLASLLTITAAIVFLSFVRGKFRR